MPLCWAPMAMCQPGCCLYSAAAWCALPGEQALQQPRLCSPDVRLGCRLRVQWSDRGLASMSYHVKTLPGTSQSCSMQALHAPPQMLGSASTACTASARPSKKRKVTHPGNMRVRPLPSCDQPAWCCSWTGCLLHQPAACCIGTSLGWAHFEADMAASLHTYMNRKNTVRQ